MKKTDWTDRMLTALVELYPVETTAYTAAVLNLSESTVKLKARELGLVKWPNPDGWSVPTISGTTFRSVPSLR